MTGAEKDEEEMFMNPGKIEEIQQRKEDNNKRMRDKLLNEQLQLSKEKKMFDEGQRTIHKDIPPSKDRIEEYKKKSFGKLFQQYEERPLSSGVTSSGVADITT